VSSLIYFPISFQLQLATGRTLTYRALVQQALVINTLKIFPVCQHIFYVSDIFRVIDAWFMNKEISFLDFRAYIPTSRLYWPLLCYVLDSCRMIERIWNARKWYHRQATAPLSLWNFQLILTFLSIYLMLIILNIKMLIFTQAHRIWWSNCISFETCTN